MQQSVRGEPFDAVRPEVLEGSNGAQDKPVEPRTDLRRRLGDHPDTRIDISPGKMKIIIYDSEWNEYKVLIREIR